MHPGPFSWCCGTFARPAWRVVLVTALALLNGCGGCGEPPALELPAEPTELPPEEVEVPEGPEVTAELNGAMAVSSSAGEPLVVRAVVLHPAATSSEAEAMVLAGSGGSWASAFRVELLDASGSAVPLETRLVVAEPAVASLHGDQAASLTWTLAPEQTSLLQPGEYLLRVRLDTRAAGEGWRGERESAALRLTLVPPPAVPTALEASARMLARVHYLKLSGDEVKARTEVDDHLAAWPDDVAALTLQGDFLLSEGRAQLALETYHRARRLLDVQDPMPMEPPLLLLERLAAAREAARP
jgi:hypothetical protein